MATADNISRDTNHPTFQPAPRFWVEATQPIQARQRLIATGDCVLIDPNGTPKGRDLVLVGDRLEVWNGQRAIGGCAVMLSSMNI